MKCGCRILNEKEHVDYFLAEFEWDYHNNTIPHYILEINGQCEYHNKIKWEGKKYNPGKYYCRLDDCTDLHLLDEKDDKFLHCSSCNQPFPK